MGNSLARFGLQVLVHDVCSWGSRRFHGHDLAKAEGAWQGINEPIDANDQKAVECYNALANEREHTLAKWCTMLAAFWPLRISLLLGCCLIAPNALAIRRR